MLPHQLDEQAHKAADRCLASGHVENCSELLPARRINQQLSSIRNQQPDNEARQQALTEQAAAAHYAHDMAHRRRLVAGISDRRLAADYDVAYADGTAAAMQMIADSCADEDDLLERLCQVIDQQPEGLSAADAMRLRQMQQYWMLALLPPSDAGKHTPQSVYGYSGGNASVIP